MAHGSLGTVASVEGRRIADRGGDLGFVRRVMRGSLGRNGGKKGMRAHFPPRPGNCLRVNRTGTVYLSFNLTTHRNNMYGLHFSSAGPAGRSIRCMRTVRRSVG